VAQQIIEEFEKASEAYCSSTQHIEVGQQIIEDDYHLLGDGAVSPRR
jgi:hypothetical protein